MASSITGFVEKFGGVKESLGVRLDIADCIKLFKTRKSICSLVKALRAIGVKFLNIGSVFSCVGGKRISSFAIDQNLLTPAVFGENFPIGESVDFALKFFNEREAQSMRAEFAKFCDKNAHWLDVYSLFSALSEQIGTHDFSKWPDILNVYVRRTAEIVKKQLQTSI
ncbi:MAG: 4-alpha-glucanotransferase, partial [Puniceicoccales bacterium]|nr:4-alpha-glucanotransferase [Puniceicoccales bacterium]